MNVVLCGMMACGKSTVGRLVAQRLGYEYADSDELIVRQHGEISRLFAERGEAFFRAVEHETIAELSKRDRLVIATGGGVVLLQQNVRALQENGKIVFLRASEQTLLARLCGDTTRPLVQGKDWQERTARILKERTPVYLAAADWVVDVDGKAPAKIADEIVRLIEK